MRLSMEIGDPACTPENYSSAMTAEIFVDDVRQVLVVTADEEEGFVKRYKTLPTGRLYQNEQGGAETEIIKGKVVIKVREMVYHDNNS